MPSPVYQQQPRPVLSQGDIIRGVFVADVVAGEVVERRTDVVVLSHDCEIQKPGSEFVLCACTRPISSLDQGRAGHVRAGRVLNAMHLPEVGPFVESLVDFRMTYRISRPVLEEAVARNGRVTSMSDDGRAALIAHIYRYFARTRQPPSH